jgi:FkbM family methyltransferase
MDKEQIYKLLNEAYFSDDPHERAIMEKLGPYMQGVRTFVDVGASLGQYTLFADKSMQDGHILAIEADPIRHEELERNCKKWGEQSTNTLQAMFAAVCDHDGEVTFNISNSNTSGGITRNETNTNPNAKWEEITVPAIKLDTLFPQDPPDFVKVDIEGAELGLLHGSERVLKSGKTVFFIELHSWGQPDAVRELMAAHGYQSQPVGGPSRVLFVPPARTKQAPPSAAKTEPASPAAPVSIPLHRKVRYKLRKIMRDLLNRS